MVAVNNEIFILGGKNGKRDEEDRIEHCTDHYQYNVSSNKWTKNHGKFGGINTVNACPYIRSPNMPPNALVY